MEEEKKLYPLRFRPLEDTYGWGAESFRLADLGYRDSLVRDGWLAGNSIGEVMDMYMDRVVGEDVFDRFGRQFPLQVKYIRIEGRQPLRVHPDDETASQRYDFLGKDKVWYVVDAGPDAVVKAGFAEDTDAGRFWQACSEGRADGMLRTEKAAAGDCFLIPAGTIHGAEGRLTIAEISESSPLDFPVHSPREVLSEEEFDPALPMTDALDFINYTRSGGCRVIPAADGMIEDGPRMTVRRFDLKAPLHIWSETATGFEVFLCTCGEASVREKDGGEYPLKPGEAMLIPSECPDVVLSPLKEGTVVLEATVNALPEPDPYINPEAAPALPEDM
ncbi:MAG: hypothetical protein IJ799_04510 [Bacteroidales bacterium]|nr:hypothetical protein [Bacteroidales bacterium]